MAAVTIAFSTGTTIRSLVADIVLPSLYTLFFKKVKILSGAFAPISAINVDNFLKELISWVFVVIITFLLIQYVIRRLVVTQQEKKLNIALQEKQNGSSVAAASISEQYSPPQRQYFTPGFP